MGNDSECQGIGAASKSNFRRALLEDRIHADRKKSGFEEFWLSLPRIAQFSASGPSASAKAVRHCLNGHHRTECCIREHTHIVAATHLLVRRYNERDRVESQQLLGSFRLRRADRAGATGSQEELFEHIEEQQGDTAEGDMRVGGGGGARCE